MSLPSVKALCAQALTLICTMHLRWLPHAITVTRFGLVAPYLYFLWQKTYHAPLILAAIIIIGDIVDGRLARRLRASSPTGASFDSIADASFVFGSLFVFYMRGAITSGLLSALIGAKAIMLLSIVIFRLRSGQWNTEHLFGDKLGGVALYMLILWLLARLPEPRTAAWIFADAVYWGVLIAAAERHLLIKKRSR